MKRLVVILGLLSLFSIPAFAEIQTNTRVLMDCQGMTEKFRVLFIEYVPGGIKIQVDGRTQVIVNAACILTELVEKDV